MFHSSHHKPVGGHVVANPTVGRPRTAEAVGEDDERPLPAAVGDGVLQDGAVDLAVHEAEDGGKARLRDEGGDVAHLVDAEVLAAWGPARPLSSHSLEIVERRS